MYDKPARLPVCRRILGPKTPSGHSIPEHQPVSRYQELLCFIARRQACRHMGNIVPHNMAYMLDKIV